MRRNTRPVSGSVHSAAVPFAIQSSTFARSAPEVALELGINPVRAGDAVVVRRVPHVERATFEPVRVDAIGAEAEPAFAFYLVGRVVERDAGQRRGAGRRGGRRTAGRVQ